jgi:predicted solute-binding protein
VGNVYTGEKRTKERRRCPCSKASDDSYILPKVLATQGEIQSDTKTTNDEVLEEKMGCSKHILFSFQEVRSNEEK